MLNRLKIKLAIFSFFLFPAPRLVESSFPILFSSQAEAEDLCCPESPAPQLPPPFPTPQSEGSSEPEAQSPPPPSSPSYTPPDKLPGISPSLHLSPKEKPGPSPARPRPSVPAQGKGTRAISKLESLFVSVAYACVPCPTAQSSLPSLDIPQPPAMTFPDYSQLNASVNSPINAQLDATLNGYWTQWQTSFQSSMNAMTSSIPGVTLAQGGTALRDASDRALLQYRDFQKQVFTLNQQSQGEIRESKSGFLRQADAVSTTTHLPTSPPVGDLGTPGKVERQGFWEKSLKQMAATNRAWRDTPLSSALMQGVVPTIGVVTNSVSDAIFRLPVDAAGLFLNITSTALDSASFGSNQFSRTTFQLPKIYDRLIYGDGARVSSYTDQEVTLEMAAYIVAAGGGKLASNIASQAVRGSADTVQVLGKKLADITKGAVESLSKVLNSPALKSTLSRLGTYGFPEMGEGMLREMADRLSQAAPVECEKIVKGLAILERDGQGFVSNLTGKEEERGLAYLAREVADRPSIVQTYLSNPELAIYADTRRLSSYQKAHIAMFVDSEKVSYFLTRGEWDKWVVTPHATTLGSKDGQYVAPTIRALMAEAEVEKSSAKLAKILGYNADRYLNKEVLRVDLHFRFEYEPHLPDGKEASANSYFKGGGYTSGGFPELIMLNPKVSDIIGSEPVSIGIFGE